MAGTGAGATKVVAKAAAAEELLVAQRGRTPELSKWLSASVHNLH